MNAGVGGSQASGRAEKAIQVVEKKARLGTARLAGLVSGLRGRMR